MSELTQGEKHLPPRWAATTMGEISTIVGGGTPRTTEATNFEGGEIPWITPADLSGYREKYISCGARNITERGLKSSSARLLPANTVLFSSRAPIGYVAIASQPVTTNQGFKSFVLAEGIDPSYCYHLLLGAKDTIQRLGGGTTFKEISGAVAATIPFALPPLAEQHRIVAEIEKQFTRLDASVESLKRAQANLKRYRASVLKSACEGTLVPTEAELVRAEGRDYEPADVLLERILAERRARWESQEKKRGQYKEPVAPDTSALPELPEGWVWATTSQLGTSQLGKMLDKKRSAGTLHQYIRNLNVRWNTFDLNDLAVMPFLQSELERFALHIGDVLVAEGGEPGRSAVWRGDERPIKFQKALHRVRLEDGVLPEWLVFRLWASAQTGILERYFTGSTIKHFTGESLDRFPIPLPPFTDQHRIVAEVERRLSVIQQSEAAVAASLARAERLRQSILKQAFSGQLVPQDPNDEPASALLERIRAEREDAKEAEAPKPRSRRARAASTSTTQRGKGARERQLSLPEAQS